MTLAADAIFRIGQRHINSGTPCQDYAHAEVLDNASLIIVSDGCSSGGRTDLGARVITLATRATILEQLAQGIPVDELSPAYIAAQRAKHIHAMADALQLESSDLLATCLYAIVTPDRALIHLEGDGIVALGNTCNSPHTTLVDWQNMPLYPAYLLSKQITAAFIEAHGGTDAKVLSVTNSHVPPPGKPYYDEYVSYRESTHKRSVADGLKGVTIELDAIKMRDLQSISVWTDGLTDMIRSDGTVPDWTRNVQEMVAFKRGHGRFQVRRTNAALRPRADKTHLIPQDDLAGATIFLPEKSC